MKRKLLGFVILMSILVMLTACDKKTKNEKVTKQKLKQDYDTLLTRYSIDAALSYLKYCSDYLNKKYR